MSNTDLPALPEPVGWRITDGEGGYNYSDESPDEFSRAWAGRYQRVHHALFTADQMQAVQREAYESGKGAALAAQSAPTEPGEWSQYVAGMIGAYLGWPVGDERERAVAGIIERRRKYDAQSAPAAAENAPSAEQQARMTNGRAAWFLERFKREEKLLGPNEQAALVHAIAVLEAAEGAQPVAPAGPPSGYEATTPGYIRYVSPERYARFSADVKRWYRPYWTAASAVEPVAPARLPFDVRELLDVEEAIEVLAKSKAERGYSGYYVTLNERDRDELCKAWPKLNSCLRAMLAAAPSPQSAQRLTEDARDAAMSGTKGEKA